MKMSRGKKDNRTVQQYPLEWINFLNNLNTFPIQTNEAREGFFLPDASRTVRIMLNVCKRSHQLAEQ